MILQFAYRKKPSERSIRNSMFSWFFFSYPWYLPLFQTNKCHKSHRNYRSRLVFYMKPPGIIRFGGDWLHGAFSQAADSMELFLLKWLFCRKTVVWSVFFHISCASLSFVIQAVWKNEIKALLFRSQNGLKNNATLSWSDSAWNVKTDTICWNRFRLMRMNECSNLAATASFGETSWMKKRSKDNGWR